MKFTAHQIIKQLNLVGYDLGLRRCNGDWLLFGTDKKGKLVSAYGTLAIVNNKLYKYFRKEVEL